MKKVLLSCAALAVLTIQANAEWISVTPQAYNFEGVGQAMIENAYNSADGANIKTTMGENGEAGVWNTVGDRWSDSLGLVAFVGNAVNPRVDEALKNGCRIADFGGTTGSVFYFVGANAGVAVNAALEPYGIEVEPMASATPFGSVNFFVASPEIHFEAGGKLRLTFVYNAFYNGTNNKFDIAVMGDGNSLGTSQVYLDGAAHMGSVEGETVAHADGEWNPEKWIEYVEEFPVPEVAQPFRFKINFQGGGAVNSHALFIKEIKVEYEEAPENSAKSSVSNTVCYTLGETPKVNEWVVVSPAGYNFEGVGQTQIENAYNSADGANIKTTTPEGGEGDAGVWNTLGHLWDDELGLLAFVGNGVNPRVDEALKNGSHIADFGGTAGGVFYFVGASAGEAVNATLAKYGLKVEPMASATPFGSVNFFAAHPSTYFEAGGKLRLTFVYNAFYNGTNNKFDIAIMGDGNSLATSQVYLDGAAHMGDIEGAAVNYADNEWNPEKWVEYVQEFPVPEVAQPLRLKVNFQGGGAVNHHALFVKEVKFEYNAAPESLDKTQTSTPVCYTVGSGTTGVASVEASAEMLNVTVSGGTATFSSAARVYNASGVLVATASAGQSVALAPGFYIAAGNGSSVKFVVR